MTFIAPFHQDDAFSINLEFIAYFKKYDSTLLTTDGQRKTVFAIGFHLKNEKVVYWNFDTKPERDLCLMNLQAAINTIGFPSE